MAKAYANAEKTYQRRERGKVIWKKRMAKGREFLDGTHRYERTFSDQGVGEMRVLNGREAKKINDKLFEDFIYIGHVFTRLFILVFFRFII